MWTPRLELPSQVHQHDPDSTGLAGDREPAGGWHGVVEGGVEPDVGVVAEQPQAVRADDPHVVGTGQRGDVVLGPGTLGSELAEARRHDHGGPDSSRHGVAEHVEHQSGRDADHDQVQRVRHVEE